MRFKKGDRVRCIDIKSQVYVGDLPGLTIGKIYIVWANHGKTGNDYDCLEIEDDNDTLRYVNAMRFEAENLPVGLGSNAFTELDFDDPFGFNEPELKVEAKAPSCDCGGEFIGGTHYDTCSLVLSGHWSKYKQENV